MPSGSRYRVLVSENVRRLLERLSKSDPVACRRLALLLLRLEKDPTPEGSRPLEPEEDLKPGERVWEYDDFLIAYTLDARSRRVEVGIVRRLTAS